MVPKTPGVVKIAGKVTNDREPQECIKLAFLPKPLYCETVISEDCFLDDQGFPRLVCVGKSSMIQRRQGTEEGLESVAQISVSFFFPILHIPLQQKLL